MAGLVRKTLTEAMQDRITTSAGSLAFHWFLAIFPAILAAVGSSGLVGLSASELRSLVHGVNVILPVQMSQTIDDTLRNPAKGAGGGVETARRAGGGAVERGRSHGGAPGRAGCGLRGSRRTVDSSAAGWWRFRC